MELAQPTKGTQAAGGDVTEHPPTGDKFNLIDNELGTAAADNASDQSPSPSGVKETAPLQRDQLSRDSDDGGMKCIKKGDGLKVIILSSISFAIVVTLALILQIYFGPPQVAPHGAVSCESKICSDIGIGVLKKGGSSVDGAIATMFCVGVVAGHHSGIGGGHFMVVHDHKTSATKVIDAREEAPFGAHKNMFQSDPQDIKRGVKSVAIPGSLKGMKLAHDKYGKLSWKSLIMPSVEIARQGFPVSSALDKIFRHHMKLSDFDESQELRDLFTKNGQFLKEGDVVRIPALGDTLDRIAKEGINVFYKGSIADDIVSTVQGHISKDDLESYKPKIKPPISTTFDDFTIYTVPPPSSGATLLLILNIMKGYNLTEDSMSEPLTYHRLNEAFKFAYGERTTLGDPVKVSNMDNITDTMISDTRADFFRDKIDDLSIHPRSYYSQFIIPPSGGTSQISVVDAEELFVSVTSTVNSWFGSKLMTKSGIILNNEMADFSLPGQTSSSGMPPAPGFEKLRRPHTEYNSHPANFIAPKKRPLSSMVPTVAMHTGHKCGPRMAVGATNGTKIITGVAEVLLNYLIGGDKLSDSIDKPRFHNQLFPYVTQYENKFDPAVVTVLQQLGNVVTMAGEGINIVSAVAKINDTISAHVDIRGSGNSSIF